MKANIKEWNLTEDGFFKLLEWLDADADAAAIKYEKIRQKLIKIFAYRGCLIPEELADETIDRVVRKIDELKTNYTGDQRLYFYGVAQNIHREYLRKQMRQNIVLPTPPINETIEREHQCLEECLKKLPKAERLLILEYYRDEKQAKISRRKFLAGEMSPNTLRKKTQRIREKLKNCINECLSGDDKIQSP
jgi:DNA-directed RNA polymerase specialized sigma24 family protein